MRPFTTHERFMRFLSSLPAGLLINFPSFIPRGRRRLASVGKCGAEHRRESYHENPDGWKRYHPFRIRSWHEIPAVPSQSSVAFRQYNGSPTPLLLPASKWVPTFEALWPFLELGGIVSKTTTKREV